MGYFRGIKISVGDFKASGRFFIFFWSGRETQIKFRFFDYYLIASLSKIQQEFKSDKFLIFL